MKHPFFGFRWAAFPTFVFVAVGAFVCSPANACEHDTFLFQLPGETETAARERSATVFHEQAVIRDFARETFDIGNASAVYVAQVIANNREQGTGVRPASKVKPIEAIKGSLPPGPRSLLETYGHSCADWGDGYGDGQGTSAEVGALVIVFEGLPKSTERPNGIDSLLATSIRDGSLLDRLSKHAKPLDED